MPVTVLVGLFMFGFIFSFLLSVPRLANHTKHRESSVLYFLVGGFSIFPQPQFQLLPFVRLLPSRTECPHQGFLPQKATRPL